MSRTATQITPEVVVEHGLSPEEYDRVLKAIGREPNPVSYTHLTLPTIYSV